MIPGRSQAINHEGRVTLSTPGAEPSRGESSSFPWGRGQHASCVRQPLHHSRNAAQSYELLLDVDKLQTRGGRYYAAVWPERYSS
jgi:hypothetical protein